MTEITIKATVIPVKETVDGITIEMSTADAVVLNSLLRCIGGPPEGPRGVLDKLMRAFKIHGVTYDDTYKLANGYFTKK